MVALNLSINDIKAKIEKVSINMVALNIEVNISQSGNCMRIHQYGGFKFKRGENYGNFSLCIHPIWWL